VPEQVRTLREFIDWMRSHPAQANYGSPGTGTLPHLLSALLAHEARADWQHVSYSGGPAAMTDLLGGRIAMLVLPEGLLRAQQAAGKLRVLATSGAQRSIFMPTVPTFVEQGFSSLVIREWFAFFMPPGTQAEVLERASASVRMASTGSALAGALGEFGMVPAVGTPGELAGRIAVEQRYWESALRTTGIRAES
jgi:tripartite-type tricarboxylate transporter receptor subunit TctC